MRTFILCSKTNKIFFILLLLTLLAFKQTYAKTFYVSPSGSNSDTGVSPSNPLKTINNALTKASKRGDIIYLMSGTYLETISVWQNGITLSAYKNDKPIIDGGVALPSKNWGSLIEIGGNYNKISGLELKNSNINGQYLGGYGISVVGHHNTISKMDVHHTWEHGIIIHGDSNIVEDSTIWQAAYRNAYNDGRAKSGWSAGLSAARNNSSSARIPGISSFITLRRNTVFNNWGEGISCYEVARCKVEDNIIYDNWTVNLYLSDATHSLVQRNLVYVSSSPEIPIRNNQNIGILLADEAPAVPRSANNKIINNLIYNANIHAFSWSETDVINAGLKNVLIAKNTIVDGGLVTGGAKEKIVNTNSQFKNNIVLGDNNYVPNKSGITFFNNNWSVTPHLAASSTDIVGEPQVSRTGSTAPGSLTRAYFEILGNSPLVKDNLSTSSNTTEVNTPPQSVAVRISSNHVRKKNADSFIINWTTNIPATGKVFYGTSADNLDSQISASNLARRQLVKISGLSRDTQYYYKISVDSETTSASSTISSFGSVARKAVRE